MADYTVDFTSGSTQTISHEFQNLDDTISIDIPQGIVKVRSEDTGYDYNNGDYEYFGTGVFFTLETEDGEIFIQPNKHSSQEDGSYSEATQILLEVEDKAYLNVGLSTEGLDDNALPQTIDITFELLSSSLIPVLRNTKGSELTFEELDTNFNVSWEMGKSNSSMIAQLKENLFTRGFDTMETLADGTSSVSVYLSVLWDNYYGTADSVEFASALVHILYNDGQQVELGLLQLMVYNGDLYFNVIKSPNNLTLNSVSLDTVGSESDMQEEYMRGCPITTIFLYFSYTLAEGTDGELGLLQPRFTRSLVEGS